MPNMGKWRDPNFESNQALVVSYHPVKCQTDWTSFFELESGNNKGWRMDKQPDTST